MRQQKELRFENKMITMAKLERSIYNLPKISVIKMKNASQPSLGHKGSCDMLHAVKFLIMIFQE